MIKSVQVARTKDQFVELAEKYAPEYSQELSIVLREVLGDMHFLEEQLREPPQQADVAQVIANVHVDSEILARKCRQLARLLDKLLDKIPDEAAVSKR
jgi:hypothetical protein